MATVTAEAPGKINLSLEILGKRADGYHELRSVVMPVSLFESVTVSERRDGAVTCETVGDGVDVSELRALPAERQLAVRAVRAMQRELGRDPSRCGCDIRVVKRVPIGAGMGGGSADAAGVLACLKALWAPDLPENRFLAAGAAVGSDVPALQLGGAVRMEGRAADPAAWRVRAADVARRRLPRRMRLDESRLRRLRRSGRRPRRGTATPLDIFAGFMRELRPFRSKRRRRGLRPRAFQRPAGHRFPASSLD